jgi:hypothetical protein
MFEEIVGTSPTLQPVLARVAKVARTDSTVLITGEAIQCLSVSVAGFVFQAADAAAAAGWRPPLHRCLR